MSKKNSGFVQIGVSILSAVLLGHMRGSAEYLQSSFTPGAFATVVMGNSDVAEVTQRQQAIWQELAGHAGINQCFLTWGHPANRIITVHFAM